MSSRKSSGAKRKADAFRYDQRALGQDQGHRDLAARHWRWGRRQLAAVSEDARNETLEAWNRSLAPPEAQYFADFVRTRLS